MTFVPNILDAPTPRFYCRPRVESRDSNLRNELPELPEVETVKRGLLRAMKMPFTPPESGAAIFGHVPVDFQPPVEGRESLVAAAKYIMIDLDSVKSWSSIWNIDESAS